MASIKTSNLIINLIMQFHFSITYQQFHVVAKLTTTKIFILSH